MGGQGPISFGDEASNGQFYLNILMNEEVIYVGVH